MSERRLVGITGASGYLGGLVTRHLDSDDWQCVRLVRRPASSTDRYYDLAAPPSAAALDGLSALVHCAYDLGLTDRSSIWAANVDGTRALLDTAKAAAVDRVIVVSSMSAYQGTTQIYGSAKLAIETEALGRGAIVVRPGLVWGRYAGGMTGTLSRLTRLRILPLPAASSHQFTLHEDDWTEAIRLLLDATASPSVPLGLAHERPVDFATVVRTLGRQEGRSVRVVRVDWRVAYAALRLVERTPMSLPVRADSLLGLARPAVSLPNPDVMTSLGFRPRPFPRS